MIETSCYLSCLLTGAQRLDEDVHIFLLEYILWRKVKSNSRKFGQREMYYDIGDFKEASVPVDGGEISSCLEFGSNSELLNY